MMNFLQRDESGLPKASHLRAISSKVVRESSEQPVEKKRGWHVQLETRYHEDQTRRVTSLSLFFALKCSSDVLYLSS